MRALDAHPAQNRADVGDRVVLRIGTDRRGHLRGRIAARVEDHATMPGAKSCDLHVEAAAGAPVLVREQDGRTPAALFAVEFHSIDRGEKAHSALNPEGFTRRLRSQLSPRTCANAQTA